MHPLPEPLASPSERRGVVMRLACIAFFYALTGYLGQKLVTASPHIALVWMPTGIAVAALWRWGRRYWPGVWLGAVAVNLLDGASPALALALSAGNTLAPLVAVALLRRWRFNAAIADWRDVVVYVVGAALLAMSVSASGGIASLVAAGLLPPHDAPAAWLTWWLADAVGVVLCGFALVSYQPAQWQRLWQPNRRSEVVASAAWIALLAVAWIVAPNVPVVHILLRTLPVAILIWIAFRMGPWPTASAVLLLAVVGAVALNFGYGPFVDPSEPMAVAAFWVYMNTVAIAAMLVAAMATARIHIQKALAQSEARFRSLTELSSDWYWEQDRAFRFVRVDGDLERRTGIDQSTYLGKTRWELPHLNLTEQDWDAHRAVLNAHLPFRDFEVRWPDHGGHMVWVSISGMPILDEQGQFAGYRGLGKDVSKVKIALEALRESEARFKTLTELSADWYWEQDADLRFTEVRGMDRVNPSLDVSTLIGKTRWELPCENMDPVLWQRHREQLARHETYRNFEVSVRAQDGSLVHYITSGAPKFDADGVFCGYRGVGSDITPRKLAEATVQRLAHFDTLTGLPNRALFRDRLEHELRRAQRSGRKIAVLMLDLDHFKEVNDSLGHDQGDRLLVAAAERLQVCVREVDTVARLGGDEFVIILSELDDVRAVEGIAQNLLAAVGKPFELAGGVGHVTASVGISVCPDDADTMEDLLKKADLAMYAAKGAGRNRFSFFTEAVQATAENRMWMSTDIRSALARHEFWLAYQPIVRLSDGTVHQAEALLRWQHPQRGLIEPGAFVPAAEASGLISAIGEWVFGEVATQAKRWRDRYSADFQISLNKSPVQFHQPNMDAASWSEQLATLGIAGRSIVVEIAESLLLESTADVGEQLRALRRQGIQVSIDDFGTGLSSLASLQEHNVDFVKIDQAFVRQLRPGSRELALSEAIIAMAHKLGIQVVAAGIETPEQRDLLLAAGCDFGQGYLFAHPMPAAEFEAYLSHNAPP